MTDILFDKEWKESGKISENSWKSEVLADLSRGGNVYLKTVSNWFNDFPGTRKEKNHLKASLRSPINTDHLGAVNELSWWKFWTSRNHDLSPIPAGKGSTPDFLLRNNGNEIAFFEITTLNPAFNKKCGKLDISQDSSINRILVKATEEKIEQFKYGINRNMPVVLVLFNYDDWTGFGAQFSKAVHSSELLSKMPSELSAIIYLERYVLGGNIYFKKETIVLKENLDPDLPVPIEIKSMVESMIMENNEMIICELT